MKTVSCVSSGFAFILLLQIYYNKFQEKLTEGHSDTKTESNRLKPSQLPNLSQHDHEFKTDSNIFLVEVILAPVQQQKKLCWVGTVDWANSPVKVELTLYSSHVYSLYTSLYSFTEYVLLTVEMSLSFKRFF